MSISKGNVNDNLFVNLQHYGNSLQFFNSEEVGFVEAFEELVSGYFGNLNKMLLLHTGAYYEVI